MTPRVADLSPAAASFHNSIPPAKQNRHGTSRTMSFERSPSGMRGTRGTRAGSSALAASGHINRRTPKGALPEATGHCLCAAASKSRPAQRPAAPRWTPERCRGLSRIHGDARIAPSERLRTDATVAPRPLDARRRAAAPRGRAASAARALDVASTPSTRRDRARRDHAIEQPRPHGRRPLTATPAQAAPPPSRPRRRRDAHTQSQRWAARPPPTRRRCC